MTTANQPAPTPDEHIAELRQMLRSYEEMASVAFQRGADDFANDARRSAAAIRWALEQNAYGVHESEVTL